MSAARTNVAPPRGMRDFYPEDMVLRNILFDTWKHSAVRHGFQQYDACVVESLDLLKRKAGEEISDQIYTFKDKSDRDLALRPEMTPTLARMIAARQGSLTLPLRWFTIAQCFRYERTTRGRKREHYQWNLDIVGEPDVAAEVEVLATAADTLRGLGLGPNDIVIMFSSRGLLTDLLLKLGISREHHAATFLALDKRGKIDDAEIEALLIKEGVDAGAIPDIFSLLSIQAFDDAVRMLGDPTDASRNVIRFMDLAQAHGIADMLRFDISVIRGLAYYTGIVFEAFDVDRKFRAVFGGGRYDNLLSQVGGSAASGVGLGFGDVVIAEILAERTDTAPSAVAEVIVGYMTEEQRSLATRVAQLLRAGGASVELALSPDKKPGRFFGRADKQGFERAAYIGPDDAASGVVRVKTLATRDETELRIG